MELKYKGKCIEPLTIVTGWSRVRLDEIAEIRGGGTPSTSSPFFWNGGVSWCTPTDITALGGSKYLTETERTITQEGLRRSSAEVIPPYSVIMTTRATIGECAINTVPMTTNQGFKNLIPTGVDADFLYYLMTTQKERLIQLCGGSTFLEVGKKQLQRFEVDIPVELTEQRAIARALSDLDALLEGLDRLIAKKRDLKQATMQQLLTGQTRLPGFTGEWEMKRLDDVGVFLKGSGIKKDESLSGDLPCIRYGEIYTHHDDCVRSYNSWISPAVAATAVRLRKGDLLFAGSGETKEEIGKCVAFIDDRVAYAGGDIVILRPYEADPIFMGYYCNTTSVKKEILSNLVDG